jgi:hypothetical protein
MNQEDRVSTVLNQVPLNNDASHRTQLSQLLKKHWLDKAAGPFAVTLQDCIADKVWESLELYPNTSKHQIVELTFLGWLREFVHVMPVDLFTFLLNADGDPSEPIRAAYRAAVQINQEDGLLIFELMSRGMAIVVADACKREPRWNSVEAYLQRKPKVSGLAKKDPTTELIEHLRILLSRQDQWKKKGLNAEKLQVAIDGLVSGTIDAATAKKVAGLVKSDRVNAGLGIRGEATDVARRVIKTVGRVQALRIAHQIIAQAEELDD